MERTRTTWFWLSVMSIALLGISLGVAADTKTAAPAATTAPSAATTAPAVAAASDSACTSCTSCLKCPCGCSPLAGAWIGQLDCSCSSWKDTIIQTFKFAPINEGCTKFVVNSQPTTRLAKVAKFWPDACDQTEFVGVACMDEWKNFKVTAISYGVQRCITPQRAGLLGVASTDATCPPNNPTPTCPPTTTTTCPTSSDKIVFIAVLTAQITIQDDCLTCGSDQKDKDGNYTGQCKEPKEIATTVYVAYFDAAQDTNHDGFPDCKCDEAVLCVKCDTCLRRVELQEPCNSESQSFVACLSACENVSTLATGRAFIKIDEGEQDVDVVITVSGLKDVKKAALQINGADVLIVFPTDGKTKEGDCEGLLVCAEFTAKDFIGSLKGKKLDDLRKALEEGRVTVVVSTDKFPKGEICGTVEDP